MPSTKQSKTAKSDAVELNDAALDQAAGGGDVPLRWFQVGPAPIKDGTSNTFMTG